MNATAAGSDAAMNGFTNFLTKAAEFYLSAPTFFNWAGPVLVAIAGGIIWLAYFLGGKFAESEINGLKAQIAALDQRFSLAKEQTAEAAKEAADLKSSVEKLQVQIKNREPEEVLTRSSKLLDANVNRVLSANTAAQGYLISTGFNEKGVLRWRPMTEEEIQKEIDQR
ncbi:hypothetical protein [Tardiphaga robiniae]|uniref:Uncharacterized protein n=1 Tax=Tardiphaga robiniae TaxID=943830 RepID=A0A7G6TVM6_9BRAD|nr:hypothetical protein [Tardiphaga robiniae]QND70808.1 hypothetical protein HB776_05845 [Tardiphaga robiniae]